MDERRIFQFLRSSLEASKACALVSVVATTGPSMRTPGAHMAVDASGRYVGSVSGGCIEQAVVAEAQEAITQYEARLTRFGTGSKYIDIRLPCGGAMDLHFQPLVDGKLVDAALEAIGKRSPFSLELSLGASAPILKTSWQETSWDEALQAGAAGHWPTPRLLILGQGENVTKLVEAASAWGAETEVHTPDRQLLGQLEGGSCKIAHLAQHADLDAIRSDPWTALVLLFHEHDWEVPAIKALIDQPHFYFGAMGSRKTHARRVEHLLQLGVAQERLDSISAPIGLISGARDPATMAISIIADVVDQHKRADFASIAAALEPSS